MWIDTHCHLDAPTLIDSAALHVQLAKAAGVRQIVLPTVHRENLERVVALARQHANCSYALGIHPSYVVDAEEDDLHFLRQLVEECLSDPQFIGLGEIGLDFFKPERRTPDAREKQHHFFETQLKMAAEFELPVLLHLRRAQDEILKHLRAQTWCGGIAHAFSGSEQQANAFIDLGFKLSFSGTFTHERAHKLRHLAKTLPLDVFVLETDAPDLPPAWLGDEQNTPKEVVRIGETLAELRGVSPEVIAEATTRNALSVLPRLARLMRQ